jgi:hypothetical protein
LVILGRILPLFPKGHGSGGTASRQWLFICLRPPSSTL